MIITLKDEELILAKERAVFFPKEQLLAISDLHLGKSAHFRKAGIQVPTTLAQSDLQRLGSLLEKFQPKTLLINGDMFHHEHNTEVDDFARWKQQYTQLEFVLVKGNHDKLDEESYRHLDIKIYDPSYCTAKFCFIHDFVQCKDETLYPISGHIHPGITLLGKAKQSLRFPCFHFGTDYAVLPAFSAFTGLSMIKPKASDQIFAITPLKVIKV
ncbi:ligase-associated DNA damage response endonuclease PdeM [Pedobacter sp. KR3-3]|uniref:Ligase-associated DNA damage response endonuclease PdeM n=1 Tax=Pedobacter albus TaxID=3113905 RepID=A0ABU7I3R1_9SPHI|nr:ligase-associated DNA damage response endonuclease PdeM [Pedobacter sp. KR3-3]MEE1944100.1 ligase-associated DNA damage response endonuclease PdeM [Pedobacter sp. KR3-3]